MTFVIAAMRRTSSVAFAALCAALIGEELIRQPSQVRLLAAACVGFCAVVAAAQWPRFAAIATLGLLPYLALARRLLLEFEPWKSTDPVLLIAPAVLAIVLIRLYVIEKRPLGLDRISKLMLFLLALTFLEAFNPQGGGLKAGAAALLFTAVPLLWFFAGRELASPRAMRILLASLVMTACVIALYGLDQTWRGMPAWDRMWVNEIGYTALNVDGAIRAFGTFSSAAEYASFLAIALVFAVAFALDRRPYLLPAVPLLGVALFYESSRGILVTTVAALIVVLAARTGSMRRATFTLITLLGVVAIALVLSRGALQSASSSSNALVAHETSGLLHPLNSQTSTLPTHLAMVEDGFRGALDPLGKGIASTTLAGAQFGNATAGSTEVDLTNEFVSTGTFGGFAFLAIVVLALAAALQHAVRQRDAVSLAIVGMLVALVGQWLNGGYYAVAPLVWFSIGFVVASERRRALASANRPVT